MNINDYSICSPVSSVMLGWGVWHVWAHGNWVFSSKIDFTGTWMQMQCCIDRALLIYLLGLIDHLPLPLTIISTQGYISVCGYFALAVALWCNTGTWISFFCRGRFINDCDNQICILVVVCVCKLDKTLSHHIWFLFFLWSWCLYFKIPVLFFPWVVHVHTAGKPTLTQGHCMRPLQINKNTFRPIMLKEKVLKWKCHLFIGAHWSWCW